MRNMTNAEVNALESQLAAAVSIADVTRIAHVAHISRLACGYRIARASVDFTAADLAWFRGPVKGGK